jgi:hypothetical protein
MRTTCIVCSKKDGRRSGLNCKECILYFHKICLNLETNDFKFLKEADEYTCQACRFSVLNYTYKTVPISNECAACLKTHKSKVVISCTSCNKSFHRACVANNKFTKKEIASKSWSCMNCINPISQLCDEELYEVCDSFLVPHIPIIFDCQSKTTIAKGLRIGHLNINGLFAKLDQFSCFIHEHNFDIFLLSETHLNFEQEYPGLAVEGYSFLRLDRPRSWGGIGCFYKSNIQIKCLDVPLFRNETEAFCLSVKVPMISQMLISCVYRKPDNTKFNEFFQDLQCYLSKMSTFFNDHKEVFLFGDLNVDLLKKWSMGDLLLRTFSEFGLSQLITEPTHFTKHSESLIDHIYVNDAANIAQSGVITSQLSNHDPIFIVRKKSRTIFNSKTIRYRNYKNLNTEDFSTDLSSFRWADIFSISENSNDIVLNFEKEFVNILNKQASILVRTIKAKPCSWIDGDIKRLMHYRDHLKKVFKSTKCPIIHEEYRLLRNKISLMCRKKQRHYLSNLFQNANSSKDFWFCYKKLTVSTEKSCVNELKVNDLILNTPDQVSEAIANAVIVKPCESVSINTVNAEVFNLKNDVKLLTTSDVIIQIKKKNTNTSPGLSEIPP